MATQFSSPSSSNYFLFFHHPCDGNHPSKPFRESNFTDEWSIFRSSKLMFCSYLFILMPLEGPRDASTAGGNHVMHPPLEGHVMHPPLEGHVMHPPLEGHVMHPPLEGHVMHPPMEGPVVSVNDVWSWNELNRVCSCHMI